jgi:DHA2 family multidrug resistance protein-like MFS transporter
MTSVAPEKAGQASGVSETSFEFGGATGIAVLGSIFVASYRGMMEDLPAGLPPELAERAHRTLAGALDAAQSLPGPEGEALIAAARAAFTQSLASTSAISSAIAFGIALFSATVLRGPHDRSGREKEAARAA